MRWWLLGELPHRLAAEKMSGPTHVVLPTGHVEAHVLKHGSVIKQRVLQVVGTVVEQSNRDRVLQEWPLQVGATVKASRHKRADRMMLSEKKLL